MTEPLVDEWIASLPNEPKFGLRGSDPEAPATILFWVEARRARLVKEPPSDKRTQDLAQCSEAEHIAWLMTDFQKGLTTEPEVLPEEVKQDQRDAIYHARRVDNAISECNDALYFLQQISPKTPPPHFAHSIKHLKSLGAYLRKAYRGVNQLKALR